MSTPPHDEFLDVFDEDGEWTGTASRGEVHRLGLWHRTFHCLIVCERKGVATAVLQRRHSSKSAFPDKLDISAAGHLEAGEEPIDGIRELVEELGIEPDRSALVPLGVRRLIDLTEGEGQNRERIHVFLLHDGRPLTDYRPDPVELRGVYDVPLRKLTELLDRRRTVMEINGFEYDPGGALRSTAWSVTFDDLILDDTGYFAQLVDVAQRFVAGESDLAI